MQLKQEQGGWNAPARVGEKCRPLPAVNLFFVPDDEAPFPTDDEKMHSNHLDQAREPAIWFRRHPGEKERVLMPAW